MAWSDKARAAAAAARKKNAKYGRRGYGVSGAKMTPKTVGTVVGISRKLKAANNRRSATEDRLHAAGMKQYFSKARGVGAGKQVPRLERKLSQAKANTARLGGWGSPHTYTLPKGTPMRARYGVNNGNKQNAVGMKYMSSAAKKTRNEYRKKYW